MQKKATAALLLQRSDWFNKTDNPEAIAGLDEDGDRIIFKLSPIVDIKRTWSVYSTDTAEAVSIELRSLDVDLVILVYQTRVDNYFLEKIITGVGEHPLIAWCYLPWRRIPRPLTYEDLVKGSSFYAMSSALGHLFDMKKPYLAAFGSADDPLVLRDIRHFAIAAQVSHELTRTDLGVLELDDELELLNDNCIFGSLGISSHKISLPVFDKYIQSITSNDSDKYLADLRGLNVEVMVTDDTLCSAAKTAVALSRLANDEHLNFFAIPDHHAKFQEIAGLCPGLPPSKNHDREISYIPSTDHGAIASSIIQKMITGNPGFMMRLWFWDKAKNLVVGGLGGVQNPEQIANGPMFISGDYECTRNDPDGGAQLEFATRPGRVTLLQMRSTPKGCKATAVSGIALESDPWIEGIPHAVVRLDCSIDNFLYMLAHSGAGEYWVMTYGSYLEELKAFFELKAIDFEILMD
jgi:hypothetical protein